MIIILFYSLMIIQHAGVYLLNNHSYEFIGLPVIPFFGLMIAQGFLKTKDVRGYFRRLIILCIVSEPFYNYMTGHPFNDIIGLSVGLALIHILKEDSIINKIMMSLITIYLLNCISFKLAYICAWVFIGHLFLEYFNLEIKRLFKRSYLNYIIYPVHLIALDALKYFF
jgi:hypothetical protein